MKKVLIVLVLGLILVTGTVFADHPGGFGIGIIGIYPNSAGLSLKVPSIPIYWALGGWVRGDDFSIHLTGDYYLIDKKIIGPLHWYLGVGVWLSFYSYDSRYFNINYSYKSFAFGGRVPVGLSVQPIPLLEIFLDIAPSMGLGFDTEAKIGDYIAHEGGMGFVLRWPVELGLRFWF